MAASKSGRIGKQKQVYLFLDQVLDAKELGINISGVCQFALDLEIAKLKESNTSKEGLQAKAEQRGADINLISEEYNKLLKEIRKLEEKEKQQKEEIRLLREKEEARNKELLAKVELQRRREEEKLVPVKAQYIEKYRKIVFSAINDFAKESQIQQLDYSFKRDNKGLYGSILNQWKREECE